MKLLNALGFIFTWVLILGLERVSGWGSLSVVILIWSVQHWKDWNRELAWVVSGTLFAVTFQLPLWWGIGLIALAGWGLRFAQNKVSSQTLHILGLVFWAALVQSYRISWWWLSYHVLIAGGLVVLNWWYRGWRGRAKSKLSWSLKLHL